MVVLFIDYGGNNLKFLKRVKKQFSRYYKLPVGDYLFRASEKEEIPNILKHGTDRGGYPPRNWESTDIPYEDVIFATTEQDIIEAEKDENRSSSFKKFKIIENPILLIYDIRGFEKIEDRQWRFLDPKNKRDYLIGIINLT